MIFTSPRRAARVLAPVCAVVVGLVVAACGSSSKPSSSNTTAPGGSTTATTAKLSSATLNGSGSTFQKPFNDEAISEFTQTNSQITINYPGGGSGKGLSDLQNKLVDFAGTDAPITNYTPYGGPDAVLYFPTVAGPITVSYNVSGVSKLTLSAMTIAQIFAGKVTTWNDPAIAADNPGVNLPNTKITPVHRSDSSGTTRNFTLYMMKTAPSVWTIGSGTTVNWPAGGATGSGNAGVAQTVKSTSGAVGYVDYSDAKAANLTFASIKNSAGTPIAPSLAGASAAVAAATIMPNLVYDPIDTSAPNAYPITSPTWIVIYKNQTNAAKGQALKAFLDFILTTGQTKVAPATDFASLQGNLLAMAKAQLNQIVIP